MIEPIVVDTVVDVGSEIEAKCSRCKLDLMHTVVAMLEGKPRRVRCLTCSGDHIYRMPASLKAAKAAERKKAAASKKSKAAKKGKTGGRGEVPDFETLAGGKRIDNPRPYAMTERFVGGEIIEHPMFGIGIVAVVRGQDKIDVSFRKGVHTLLHNRTLPLRTN
ncbi:MAG: hypothetical protein LBM75_01160 [Myxococcales bacterium]|nr:hypothetical protein [Myxococcales bacterium]